MSNNEIILYQPDGSISLEVRVENETIWLTQKQMAQLYGTAVPAISKHIKNIFDSGELQAEATVSKMRTPLNTPNRLRTIVLTAVISLMLCGCTSVKEKYVQ